MKEQIVLVDRQGKPIGVAEKLPSHHINTPLHLAFSCYVFNGKGEFLVTRRAQKKKVWPGVWTNSVCGHPAPDEAIEAAIARRLQYELGMKTESPQLTIPNYVYKTPPFKGVIEHEYCPIFFARSVSELHPNPDEVDDYKWVEWQDFVKAAKSDRDDSWSWWCKDQLKILENHPQLRNYLNP